ncbi:MAG TPA: acetyl-CoA carboxylase biotin carboxylase subunit [Phycisphaerae bacterium]|nr:acetyl-CoA carboxylase biotin carboxylase subunit [Phycisphaerae bacterium]
MFSRILIANRGEIALRIMRACKELRIQSVLVYSEADRDAAYLKLADQAICIGPARPSESYLRSDRIIAAAEVSGVDAIHPGYGFLAENARFADQCRESKIEFIGPTADSMTKLGDKANARQVARRARVTIVPGSDGVIEDNEEAAAIADRIGYPVIVKAVSGGGGRGMRIVHDAQGLAHALSNARAEAEAAFNDASVYLEKYIEKPRHVEVQVLGDLQGNVVHLWERDCTIQRRHQKLVEESPSPAIGPETRRELCKAAVRLARAAKYSSAGTFEFLVDEKEHFYFIEANTRIQVEHPVTEMVTGLDLIKWQLRIAAGEAISFKQREVREQGAAIECRINAEDPENGFRPCPGRIEHLRIPGGLGVRFDSHIYAGYTISPVYDSLIGKLIVHAPTRDEAIDRMLRCLEEFAIAPIKTTVPLHRKILDHRLFRQGRIHTSFVEQLG